MSEEQKFASSYVALDMEASVEEFSEGVQGGETCNIKELKHNFGWVRGWMYGWYGFSNSGKTTYLDFQKVLKSKYDGYKWGIFKHEEMDSVTTGGKPKMYRGKPMMAGPRVVKTGGKVEIKANRIYKDLAWMLTGKTWNHQFAKDNMCESMTFEEELEALEFITEHFFVINPKDRSLENIALEFRFLAEHFGIDGWEIDPWNTVIVKGKETNDVRLSNGLMHLKEMTLETNTVGNIVNHPRTLDKEKYTTGEDKGRYIVINSSHVLGGTAWGMKMDVESTIYRPEAHLDPNDPKVKHYTWKVKNSQLAGFRRGVCDGIEFDPIKRQYYFKGFNPLSGENKFKNTKEQSDTLPF